MRFVAFGNILLENHLKITNKNCEDRSLRVMRKILKNDKRPNIKKDIKLIFFWASWCIGWGGGVGVNTGGYYSE